WTKSYGGGKDPGNQPPRQRFEITFEACTEFPVVVNRKPDGVASGGNGGGFPSEFQLPFVVWSHGFAKPGFAADVESGNEAGKIGGLWIETTWGDQPRQ